MGSERKDNPVAVAGVYVLCAVVWGLLVGVGLAYYPIVIGFAGTWEPRPDPPAWTRSGFWAYGQDAVPPRFVAGFCGGVIVSVFFTRRGLRRRGSVG